MLCFLCISFLNPWSLHGPFNILLCISNSDYLGHFLDHLICFSHKHFSSFWPLPQNMFGSIHVTRDMILYFHFWAPFSLLVRVYSISLTPLSFIVKSILKLLALAPKYVWERSCDPRQVLLLSFLSSFFSTSQGILNFVFTPFFYCYKYFQSFGPCPKICLGAFVWPAIWFSYFHFWGPFSQLGNQFWLYPCFLLWAWFPATIFV